MTMVQWFLKTKKKKKKAAEEEPKPEAAKTKAKTKREKSSFELHEKFINLIKSDKRKYKWATI